MAKTGGVCALRRLQESLTEKTHAHLGIRSCHPYLTETDKDLSEETPKKNP